MESSMDMLMHSAGIAVIIFLVLRFLLKQKKDQAEARAMLIGALSLVYMLIWGHGAPSSKINKLIY
jgi:hypothetical protein